MDKRRILEQLLTHFAYGNQTQFARLLGCKQGVVSGWLRRDTLDSERIKAAFPQVDGNWLLTGKGQMLLPEEGKNSVQVNGHNNTTKITSSVNINNHKTIENEEKKNVSEIQLLKQEIALLRALLDEKERLINVLMEHTKWAK